LCFKPLLESAALDKLSANAVIIFVLALSFSAIVSHQLLFLPSLPIFGHKSVSVFDLWSIQHFLVGIGVGRLFVRLIAPLANAHNQSRYTELYALSAVVSFVYIWEWLETCLENGLVGGAVANWFHGQEWMLNRWLMDPLLVFVGYFIGRKCTRVVWPSRVFVVSFLIVFVFYFKHSMAYMY